MVLLGQLLDLALQRIVLLDPHAEHHRDIIDLVLQLFLLFLESGYFLGEDAEFGLFFLAALFG